MSGEEDRGSCLEVLGERTENGFWCQGPARGLFYLWFFRERLAREEVALGKEVGSGSGGETQERAGAGEEVVVLFPTERRQEKRI